MKKEMNLKIGDKVKARIGMNFRTLKVYAVSYIDDFKIVTLVDEKGFIIGDFFESQCKPCT